MIWPGDVVTLKSGERCRVRGREFTDKGLAVLTLTCLTREWTGLLRLTAAELERNAV